MFACQEFPRRKLTKRAIQIGLAQQLRQLKREMAYLISLAKPGARVLLLFGASTSLRCRILNQVPDPGSTVDTKPSIDAPRVLTEGPRCEAKLDG